MNFAGLFQKIIDTVSSWGSGLYNSLGKFRAWIAAMVVAIILAPVDVVLTLVENQVKLVEWGVESLQSAVDKLHVSELSGLWGVALSVMAKADAWVPVSLAVEIGMALIALWAICLLIRLALKVKAIFWAG